MARSDRIVPSMGDPGSGLHTSERSEEVDGGGLDAIHLDGDCRYLDNPTMRGLAQLPLKLVPAKVGA